MLAGRVRFHDDDPGPRLAWLRAHMTSLERVPSPGSGLTVQRWRALAELGAADGALARLAAGHLDALAILDELGAADGAGALRGVWAAEPSHLRAESERGGWRLRGRKPWCSGAAGLDRALVTATDPDGVVRLFDVDVASLRFADDRHPVGMRASDSRTACFDIHVGSDQQVGGPGAYVGRPGFWHAGVGVAACWHGIAERISRDLADHAEERREDQAARAASGGAVAVLAASSALLAAAGRQIDERPGDEPAARRRALLVRVAVERSSREVLRSAVVAQAGALDVDGCHGRAVSDLTAYLGHLHDGHDAGQVEHHAADDWWSS